MNRTQRDGAASAKSSSKKRRWGFIGVGRSGGRMDRTSVVADGDLILELRCLAQRRGVPFSEVVRCALVEYAAKNAPAKRRLTCSGIGSSGGKLRLSERVDELLYRRRA